MLKWTSQRLYWARTSSDVEIVSAELRELVEPSLEESIVVIGRRAIIRVVDIFGVGRVGEADSNGRFDVDDVGFAIPSIGINRETLTIGIGAEWTILSEKAQKRRSARTFSIEWLENCRGLKL